MTLKKLKTPFVVLHQPDPNDPTFTRSLDDIRKILPPGKWRHSRVYEEVGIAVEKLGIDPFDFWTLPKESQATIIAYYRAEATIRNYEEYLARPKPH